VVPDETARRADGTRLRPALPADAETIARLHIESWRSAYRRELSAAFLLGLDIAGRTTDWAEHLRKGVTAMIAEVDGEPLGFVACGPSRNARVALPEWEIYNLHVAPGVKGRGIGSRLFDAAAEAGVRAGAGQLGLWVFEGNTAARAFYERKGMRLGPEREEHFPAPDEKVIERRYLMPLGPFPRA
jgi:ribosomal protein S18 acetylase RimI-like enzyme